ncbi:MAG: hypothetical protein LBQ34_00255 [Alphaproteobacteria bacterium]|jgi:hypothetical protein|nr:hypothetical protein [Alphaproteobacteria bacterium]
MKKYFLGLALVLLTVSIAHADLFETTLRIVGTSDKDTNQAKLEAINQGRQDSLMFVISKIVSRDSLDNIKQLLEQTKPITFEKRFSLNRENITNKKYEADATFVFDEKKIKEFLSANKIPFVSVSLGRYMIIPAFYDENGNLVEDNIWNNYWQMRDSNSNNFLSTLVYYNNPNVISNRANLLEIKKNLGLDEVFLLNLYTEKNKTYTLSVQNVISGKTTRIEGILSVQQATFMAPSIMEEERKREILASYLADSSTTVLNVVYKNYEDWIFIESKLKSASSVAGFSLQNISEGELKVRVDLKTNMEKFKNAMEGECVLFDIPSLTLSKIENAQ